MNDDQTGCDFYTALQVINDLIRNPEIGNKIYISGDLVPWIFTGENSMRKHCIDLLVDVNDMGSIRNALGTSIKDDSIYFEEIDGDYGFTSHLDGALVTFYPFQITGSGITIYSYNPSLKEQGCQSKELIGLKREDLFTTMKLINGNIINIVTPEAYLVNLRSKGALNIGSFANTKEKYSSDWEQLSKCIIDIGKYKTIDDSKDEVKEDEGYSRDNSSKLYVKTSTSSKPVRKTGSSRGGYIDALILAFITGVIGGLFLFILLHAIQ